MRRASFKRCGVRLGVDKVQRIVRGQLRVVLDPWAIEQEVEALARSETEMVLALRADVGIALEILLPNDGAATGALDP